jgi:hypothetical protein
MLLWPAQAGRSKRERWKLWRAKSAIPRETFWWSLPAKSSLARAATSAPSVNGYQSLIDRRKPAETFHPDAKSYAIRGT